MTTYEIANVKGFMGKLLKSDVFDRFETRGVSLQTFTALEVTGILNKQSMSEDEKAQTPRFCSWTMIKPLIYQMIKGGSQPESLKIIFSVPDADLSQIHQNAAALFINIHFENKRLSVVTGTSIKSFSLDKSLDELWDDSVFQFLSKNGMQPQKSL